MMKAWSSTGELKPYKPEVISLFMQSINKDPAFYNEYVYERMLHCLTCGLAICTITNQVLYAVDNPGLPLEMLTGYGYVEVRCKRCKQPYRIFV